jgi:ABC-type dipeptide/oligopeptide/nickel transport system ATPase component
MIDPAIRLQTVKDTQRTRLGMVGLTILVVTHDFSLAWNVADRLAVMYLGRIVEQGPTEQVLAAPRHPYTRALLSVVPRPTTAGRRCWRASRPTGCRTAAASTRAARPWPAARQQRPAWTAAASASITLLAS